MKVTTTMTGAIQTAAAVAAALRVTVMGLTIQRRQRLSL
jgi:hypothetical protein